MGAAAAVTSEEDESELDGRVPDVLVEEVADDSRRRRFTVFFKMALEGDTETENQVLLLDTQAQFNVFNLRRGSYIRVTASPIQLGDSVVPASRQRSEYQTLSMKQGERKRMQDDQTDSGSTRELLSAAQGSGTTAQLD